MFSTTLSRLLEKKTELNTENVLTHRDESKFIKATEGREISPARRSFDVLNDLPLAQGPKIEPQKSTLSPEEYVDITHYSADFKSKLNQTRQTEVSEPKSNLPLTANKIEPITATQTDRYTTTQTVAIVAEARVFGENGQVQKKSFFDDFSESDDDESHRSVDRLVDRSSDHRSKPNTADESASAPADEEEMISLTELTESQLVREYAKGIKELKAMEARLGALRQRAEELAFINKKTVTINDITGSVLFFPQTLDREGNSHTETLMTRVTVNTAQNDPISRHTANECESNLTRLKFDSSPGPELVTKQKNAPLSVSSFKPSIFKDQKMNFLPFIPLHGILNNELRSSVLPIGPHSAADHHVCAIQLSSATLWDDYPSSPPMQIVPFSTRQNEGGNQAELVQPASVACGQRFNSSTIARTVRYT